jgi:hypothetical protein
MDQQPVPSVRILSPRARFEPYEWGSTFIRLAEGI